MGGRGGRDRGLHRRRRASRAGTLFVVVLLVAAGLAGYAARRHPDLLVAAGVRASAPAAGPARPAVATPVASPVPAAGRVPPGISYPARGTGGFRTATGVGAVAGRGGELLRYRVAVEEGIGNVDVERFAREVAATWPTRAAGPATAGGGCNGWGARIGPTSPCC
ncbi:hypothetical protein AB0F68_03985 [Micromonospora sp. NPDC023966]|uniref:hypothetical protein n=1 Tax=Micromonospora sp. NPDC023966 TaxID=3154699 RepID=UPI003401AA15